MIKDVTDTLMNVYGYEHRGFITHPLKDKYDVMLVSGPVSILLTDDINAEKVSMRIIENDRESRTVIEYGRKAYADDILNALAMFAIERLNPEPKRLR